MRPPILTAIAFSVSLSAPAALALPTQPLPMSPAQLSYVYGPLEVVSADGGPLQLIPQASMPLELSLKEIRLFLVELGRGPELIEGIYLEESDSGIELTSVTNGAPKRGSAETEVLSQLRIPKGAVIAYTRRPHAFGITVGYRLRLSRMQGEAVSLRERLDGLDYAKAEELGPNARKNLELVAPIAESITRAVVRTLYRLPPGEAEALELPRDTQLGTALKPAPKSSDLNRNIYIATEQGDEHVRALYLAEEALANSFQELEVAFISSTGENPAEILESIHRFHRILRGLLLESLRKDWMKDGYADLRLGPKRAYWITAGIVWGVLSALSPWLTGVANSMFFTDAAQPWHMVLGAAFLSSALILLPDWFSNVAVYGRRADDHDNESLFASVAATQRDLLERRLEKHRFALPVAGSARGAGDLKRFAMRDVQRLLGASSCTLHFLSPEGAFRSETPRRIELEP